MPFHLRVTQRNSLQRGSDALVLDKDEEWLLENVVEPRQRGAAMFVAGRVIEWDDVDEIHITETSEPSSAILPRIRARRSRDQAWSVVPDEWHVARDGTEVTDRFIQGSPGASTDAVAEPPATARDPSAVMVVHGQDSQASKAMMDWLRAIRLRPLEWSVLVNSTGAGSPFIGEVLRTAFTEAQAVVALFTPDERVALREELSGRVGHWRLQARPNVLFEAGMAFAMHPERTVLVVLGDQELPSDLAGRHFVRVTDAASLHQLARRLETAGCPVDSEGADWLDEARFPNRSGIASEPVIGTPPDERMAELAATLLAAHARLLHHFSAGSVYKAEIKTARNELESAIGALEVRASRQVGAAAEGLRKAWAPRSNGLYMGTGNDWRLEVEAARQAFIDALSL